MKNNEKNNERLKVSNKTAETKEKEKSSW